MSLHSLCE